MIQEQEPVVSIIGLGFVGLTTAAVFVSKGAKVIGVEQDPRKIYNIMSGKPPFCEPSLDELLKAALAARNRDNKKRFTITRSIPSAVKRSTLVFITVGTPPLKNGAANLSFVERCAIEIGNALADSRKYHTIVMKSTVPPGTTLSVVGKNISKYSNKIVDRDYGLVFNPEFLREGSAVADALSPHLIVMGAHGSKSNKRLLSFYRFIYNTRHLPVIETTIPTAELIKYANNSFLATKISFINSIANICSKIPDTDIEVIAKAIGLDPRIGGLYLKAGPGYGGSCLPKDLSALIHFCRTVIHYKPLLLEGVQSVNERQYLRVLEMIENFLKGSLEGKQIAILGLAFKKDTDDIRESVSLKLISALKQRGALLRLHDPVALENTKSILASENKDDKTLRFYDDYLACITDAECCVIMTEWEQYKNITPRLLRQCMKSPNLVDARRMLDDKKFDKINFRGIGLGGPRKVFDA